MGAKIPVEIMHENYQVHYDEASKSLSCKGSFRLQGSEYQPIQDLMNGVADSAPQPLTVDLRELEFLNSSGINTLAKFVLQLRKNGVSEVKVQGSNKYPWQEKSLKNLQRLLPSLELEIS